MEHYPLGAAGMIIMLIAVPAVSGCTGLVAGGGERSVPDAPLVSDGGGGSGDHGLTNDRSLQEIGNLDHGYQELDLPPLDAPVTPPDKGLPPSGDKDKDGILNGADNCPLKANPCQNDKDDDGIGDVCDPTCTEVCVGQLCVAGIVGCNCGPCPSGHSCLYDTHAKNGLCYAKPSDFHKICTPKCTKHSDCPGGLYCYQFSSGCSCSYLSMTGTICSTAK